MDAKQVSAFFDDYAQALSAGDPARIADFWHVPALVVGDGNAIPVNARAETEECFRQSVAHYRASGVETAVPGTVDVVALSETTSSATIHWVHEDSRGEVNGGEDAFYVLIQDGTGSVSIVFYTPITLATAAEADPPDIGG